MKRLFSRSSEELVIYTDPETPRCSKFCRMSRTQTTKPKLKLHWIFGLSVKIKFLLSFTPERGLRLQNEGSVLNTPSFQYRISSGVGRFFFRGGDARPLKGYHAPPAGGPGGEGPPEGSEVSFFQTMQSIRKWIHFSKIATFFFPKRSIFSKKKLGKLNIFYKNFWIFSKNYYIISLVMIPSKSREILCEF